MAGEFTVKLRAAKAVFPAGLDQHSNCGGFPLCAGLLTAHLGLIEGLKK
jgi:hypothetical protein